MISFLICAYNEEKNIKGTVESILNAVKQAKINKYEIIIVDDGSTDETYNEVNNIKKTNINIIYLKNEKNLGYGRSVKRGIVKISFDKFMIVPGDNDLTSNTIYSGIKFLNKADLILIFPINTENRSKIRNVISIAFRLIYLAIFSCNVNYINSPSILPTKNIKSFELKSNKFSIISEMTTKLLCSGVTFAEVPTYFKSSLRRRRTVTIKNLIDVIYSFVNLFIEIKIKKKKQFNKNSTRIMLEF